jgi:hypothetical protein
MNSNSDKELRNDLIYRDWKEIRVYSWSFVVDNLLLKGNSMIRFKSIPRPRQAGLFLALLLTAAFGAACGGAAPNSTSSSSSSSSSAAVAPGTAFEGEITYKMSAGTGMRVRHAIKGTRSRIEMQLPAGGPETGSMVTLMDMSSQTTTTLMPQTKTYMTMNWNEVAEQMTKAAENDPVNDFSKVSSNGKTETIAGINCRYWQVGDKMEMCLAQGMGYFGGGGGPGGILEKLKDLAQRDKLKAQLDANPEFAKFVEGGAFPLKMASIENGQSTTIMEVTSVERKSLDDSIFNVPADYKKMEIPKIPGMPMMKQ